MVAERNGIPLIDDYIVRIEIPSSYPLSLPEVYEESDAIPSMYEHFYQDKRLCLGVQYELFNKLNKSNNSFRYFFDEFVLGYFYSVSYFKKYGCLPFGERAHGLKGIIEYYKELFSVDTIQQIVMILKTIYFGKYRGHHDCPCGSQNKGRKCHGNQILYLIKTERKKILGSDLYDIIEYEKRLNDER